MFSRNNTTSADYQNRIEELNKKVENLSLKNKEKDCELEKKQRIIDRNDELHQDVMNRLETRFRHEKGLYQEKVEAEMEALKLKHQVEMETCKAEAVADIKNELDIEREKAIKYKATLEATQPLIDAGLDLKDIEKMVGKIIEKLPTIDLKSINVNAPNKSSDER